MARYSNTITCAMTEIAATRAIEGFMAREGFDQFTQSGEVVWKKGMGILTAPQFIKTTVQANQIHLEAWLKYPLLPGVYVGEMGITGIFGALPKKWLRDCVKKLESLLLQG
jgi:hypothetical protein